MKKILEFKDYDFYTKISESENLEMANISPKKTGLKDVFIWVGPNPHTLGKRIKVSNIPNKFGKDNCFTITIPKFEIIGEVESWITTEHIKDLEKFISINMDLIIDFSDEKISTDEFNDGIIKI
jgi:hypothetical protein